MNISIPAQIENALMDMGVLSSTDFDADVMDDPKITRRYIDQWQEIDENGADDIDVYSTWSA